MSTPNPDVSGVSGSIAGETVVNAGNSLGAGGGTRVKSFCNGVIPFIWDRLQLSEYEHNRIPALAEDWFVEEALALGSPFVWRKASPEHSHRLLYRHARKVHIEIWGRTYPKPEWIMLDIMVNTMSAVTLMAASVLIEQRPEMRSAIFPAPTPEAS